MAQQRVPKYKVQGHQQFVRTVCLAKDGTTALSGGEDCRVVLWDLVKGVLIGQHTEHKSGICCVEFADRKDFARSVDVSQATCDWNYGNNTFVNGMKTDCSKVSVSSSAVYSPDRKRLLSIQANDLVLKRPGKRGDLGRLEGHTGLINVVCFSADGDFALSGSMDSTVRLWDVRAKTLLSTCKGHASGVTSIALSRDNKLAVSGDADGLVIVWNL